MMMHNEQQELRLSQAIDTTASIEGAKVTVELEPGTHVRVIDDLEASGIAEGEIILEVHEDATLHYELKSLEVYRRFIARGDDQSNDTVVPAYKTVMTEDHTDVAIHRNLTIRLLGRNARAYVRCVCLGSGKQKFHFSILQDHQAEAATSDVVVKGILDNESNLFCKGLIHIAPDGQQTHAELDNKAILLSKEARAVSIPTLEIKADDVVCKHGAAVSKFDDEQLFYLQSRGIDPASAQQLLIDSFLLG